MSKLKPILIHCLSCKKKTATQNPRKGVVGKRAVIKGICTECGKQKQSFVEK